MKKYNVAVVGATGMVGNKFLEVLAERNLPVENYYLYASAKSAGKVIDFMGKPHTVIELTKENVVDKKNRHRVVFRGRKRFKGIRPDFCKYRRNRRRQQQLLAYGRERSPCRARGQPRRRQMEQRHHRQPELQHDSGYGGIKTPARQIYY